MEIPGFSEFRSSLTKEQLKEMWKFDFYENIQITDIGDAANINALVKRVIDITVAYSAAFNFRLLEAYHEWLQKQI